MTRKSSLSWICGAAATLLMASTVNAQPPGYAQGGPPPGFQGGPPSGFQGAPGQTTDPNAISNIETTSTTTTTNTEFVDETATLPNTGGEPLLMALIGSMMAGSALFLRRRLS